MTWETDHLASAVRYYWYGVRVAFDTPLLLTTAPFDVAVLTADYTAAGLDYTDETYLSSTQLAIDQLNTSIQGNQENTVTIGNADGVIGAAVLALGGTNRHPAVEVLRFWYDSMDPLTNALQEVKWISHGRFVVQPWTPELVTFKVVPDGQVKAMQLPGPPLGPRCTVRAFKDAVCGYAGAGTTCDRSISQCTTYANQDRFQGDLYIPPPGTTISYANGSITIPGA